MGEPNRFKRLLTPSFIVQFLAVFVIGSLIGVGLFTFVYAKGYSYLTNDPNACNNCHAMNHEYDGWIAGSHANVATCGDCHTPHDNLVHKYYVKAENGFWHALKFTTGWYPEHIQAREVSRRITNDACLHCHADLTDEMHLTAGKEQIQCTHCHAEVGHKR
ncbi:cytochrome c nitrite reductase small subunit [Gleimia hominis]|uniref:Cytochrome c nitrite reductase small subunit n=1 Tax=Gleimia hominis TaxID=595468 RepID=A0ABU3IC99_9ACTO|nr:cytochrome c nitrite reductase small subunit [Gleimia hominis]MDT3767998.1 cytochrome c nitrite reductase small subunit [Gleimia hominis]WIK63787.1 cytochrome c nitrite reductase small subunit [Gleimia hominis]